MFCKIVRHISVAAALLSVWGCDITSNDVVTLKEGNTVYKGQTANGKRNGLGVLYMGDSVAYSGQWKDGLRQGQGQVTDSLGRLIEGVWDHDTIVSGTRRDSAGVYQGEFSQRLTAQGYGTYHDNNGTYYEGQWKNDERTGFGFSSQHRFFRVGEWKKDVYKGERLSYTSDRIYGIDISKYQHGKGRKRYSIDWKRLRISHLGTLSKKTFRGGRLQGVVHLHQVDRRNQHSQPLLCGRLPSRTPTWLPRGHLPLLLV